MSRCSIFFSFCSIPVVLWSWNIFQVWSFIYNFKALWNTNYKSSKYTWHLKRILLSSSFDCTRFTMKPIVKTFLNKKKEYSLCIKTQRKVVSDFPGFFAENYPPSLFTGWLLKNAITFFLFDPPVRLKKYNRQKFSLFQAVFFFWLCVFPTIFYPFFQKITNF